MVGNNLKDTQLQQIVDKTILFHDKDGDGKISFEEFCDVSRSGDLGVGLLFFLIAVLLLGIGRIGKSLLVFPLFAPFGKIAHS